MSKSFSGRKIGAVVSNRRAVSRAAGKTGADWDLRFRSPMIHSPAFVAPVVRDETKGDQMFSIRADLGP